MAISFDDLTPVVNFKPNPDPYKVGERRNLFWPALAYKVIVPMPRMRPLNLFQFTVLRLCEAGMFTPPEIAARLAIETDLVAYILHQLQGQGLLDLGGLPTERGLRILGDDAAPAPEPTPAYLFMDPFTRELWPRVVFGPLPYADVELEGGRATIRDSKRGREYPARVHIPPQVRDLVRPSPVAMLRALQHGLQEQATHLKRLQDRFGAVSPLDPEHLSQGIRFDRARDRQAFVERVVLMDEAPMPLYLGTYLFVPSDLTKTSYWQVCDPFGMGISRGLRSQIDRMVQAGQAPNLQRMIQKATGAAYAVESLDLVELLSAQRAEACAQVSEKTGSGISEHPELLQLLIQMEEARTRHQDAAGSGQTSQQMRQKQLKAAMAHAYAAVEQLFELLVTDYPTEGLLAPLVSNARENAGLLIQIARQIGLETSEAIARQLLTMGRGQIEPVLMPGRPNLPAQVAAAILLAQRLPDHPLHRAIRQNPEWLLNFAQLKVWRDAANHDSGEFLPLDAIERTCDWVYELVGMLVERPADRTRGDEHVRHEAQRWRADLSHRVQALAREELERRLGSEIRQFGALRDPLLELYRLEKLLEVQVGESSDVVATEGMLREVAIELGKVCEAALDSLLSANRGPVSLEGFSQDRKENHAFLSGLAQDLGFEVGPKNRLPQALTGVRPDRVERARRSGKGTISAMFVLALLAARTQPAGPLVRIAERHPGFLLDLALLTAKRDHASKVTLVPGDVPALSETALRIAENVLLAMAVEA